MTDLLFENDKLVLASVAPGVRHVLPDFCFAILYRDGRLECAGDDGTQTEMVGICYTPKQTNGCREFVFVRMRSCIYIIPNRSVKEIVAIRTSEPEVARRYEDFVSTQAPTMYARMRPHHPDNDILLCYMNSGAMTMFECPPNEIDSIHRVLHNARATASVGVGIATSDIIAFAN